MWSPPSLFGGFAGCFFVVAVLFWLLLFLLFVCYLVSLGKIGKQRQTQWTNWTKQRRHQQQQEHMNKHWPHGPRLPPEVSVLLLFCVVPMFVFGVCRLWVGIFLRCSVLCFRTTVGIQRRNYNNERPQQKPRTAPAKPSDTWKNIQTTKTNTRHQHKPTTHRTNAEDNISKMDFQICFWHFMF